MGNQLSSSGSAGKLVLAGTVIATGTHAWNTGNLLLAGTGIGAVALAWKLGFLKCSKKETKEVNRSSNDSPHDEELSSMGRVCVLAIFFFFGFLVLVGLILILSELNDKELSDSQLLPNQSQRTPVLIDGDSTDGDSQSLDEVCDSRSFCQRKIKIITYNLCHPKKESLYARMKAVTLLVREHMPDVVLFQEATSEVHEILMSFPVWHLYECVAGRSNCMVFSKLPMNSMRSVSFTEGGELLLTNTDICNGKDLLIATTHLKCSTRNSKAAVQHQKRTSQAKEAIKKLSHYQNIVFGGDMNWRNTDGCFPLASGWIDAWQHLMPYNPGYTFDTETNPLLKGRKILRQRLDRFLCKLNDFELVDIKIIGNTVIPVLVPCESAAKESTAKEADLQLVNISDHYGLILTLCVI